MLQAAFEIVLSYTLIKAPERRGSNQAINQYFYLFSSQTNASGDFSYRRLSVGGRSKLR